MYDDGKSDSSIVPMKSANNDERGVFVSSAEQVEERGLAKGNVDQQYVCRTQSRESMSSASGRVRKIARNDKEVRFTSQLTGSLPTALWLVIRSVLEMSGIDTPSNTTDSLCSQAVSKSMPGILVRRSIRKSNHRYGESESGPLQLSSVLDDPGTQGVNFIYDDAGRMMEERNFIKTD